MPGRTVRNADRREVALGPCTCTALRKATRRVSQLYDAALAPCGLRTTQRALLKHILRAGMPAIGELAEALVMDRGALAHTLKPLERDGLVTVEIDAADRRNRRVVLTETGLARLAESEALWAMAERRFEGAFGAARTVSLRETLGLILSPAFLDRFEGGERPGQS